MYERQTSFATFNQHSTKKRLFLFVGHNCDQSEVIIIKRPLTSRNAGTYGIHINVLLNYTRPVFTWKARSPFLESPETFRVLFEWRTSLCIFKTKASRGTKLCSCLNLKRPASQSKRVGVLWMAFLARKAFGTFEKRAPGLEIIFGWSPVTITCQIHFCSVTYRFRPVKCIWWITLLGTHKPIMLRIYFSRVVAKSF